MSLFRRQAVDYHRRLHGDVFLVPPVRWQVIGYLLATFIAGATLFLAFGSYSRSITGNGIIRPDSGMADIAIPEDGVLTALPVRDGQTVHRGQIIARLSLDRRVAGRSLAEARDRALGDQSRALHLQSGAARADADESRAKLASAIADERQQLAALDRQIASQTALILSSREDLARVRDVADKGFISGYEMQKRRELLINRQQGLAELQQARSAHEKALAVAVTEQAALPERLRGTLGGYEAQLAQVRREGAALDNTGSIDLVATRDGVLTAVLGHVGDSVTRGQRFARIVPPGAAYIAELKVPSSTISQIAPGQEVRITLAPYPLAQYGVLHGVIRQVSAAPVEGADPAFIVIARLDPPSGRQRERGLVLRPGLVASGRIILDRRSFFHWLIDPISAVARR